MTELRVHDFTDGGRLHEWIFAPEATEVDRRFRAYGDADVGATIMGGTCSARSAAPGGPPPSGAGGGARTRRSTTTSSS